MKEGWTEKKLKEVCRVINGRAYAKGEMLTEGKYRLLRVGNFFTNDSWFYSDLELEDDKYCENGDLLYAWSASFGPKIWDGEKVIYHYHIWKMVCSNEVDKRFMFYWLDSDGLKKQTMTNLHGSTMAHITKGIIENAIIKFPSIVEQKIIVERLDAAFENIDKLKANAGKQLAEAQTLFQKSLAKAMEPKEGWEEKTMSEITEVKDGTHDSPKYVTEGIPFVTQKNITINGVDLINTKKITLEDHKKFYTRSNVEFGDIIIAMIGANRGMSCIVNTREIFSIKNVGLIKKTDNINMRFLLYYLHSPAANSYVLENSNGGAQEFIGLKGLRNFPIQFPSLAEQQRIVERLDALSENIRKYEEIQRQIISECDALKQALLRKVFE